MHPRIEEEVYKIVSNLLSKYLSNIVKFQDNTLNSYLPVLNALLNSQLKKLRYLNFPVSHNSGDIANYASCVLLMKNRLENMYHSNHFDPSNTEPMEQSFFNQLYDNLGQFDKLKTLNVVRTNSSAIQDLEYISRSCRSLEDLRYECFSFDTGIPSQSLVKISKTTPRPAVKSLEIRALMLDNYQEVILFIMHVFPNLSYLNLKLETPHGNRLDRLVFSQFLHYMSCINHVKINDLEADYREINDCVKELWHRKPRPGLEALNITYDEKDAFELIKAPDYDTTNITYSFPGDWKCIDFLEKNGKFLRSLVIEKSHSIVLRSLPGNVLIKTFKHSPNLQVLDLLEWCLEEPTDISGSVPVENGSLELLRFQSCDINRGGFAGWTALLPKIVTSKFSKVKNSFGLDAVDENGCTKILDVFLPDTKIDFLRLSYDCSPEDYVCIQVQINDGPVYYYCYDPTSKRCCRELSREEYMNLNGQRLIHVSCASKPVIGIE